MDVNRFNIGVLPSQDTMGSSPKEENATENMFSQDKCKSSCLVNESNIIVNPLGADDLKNITDIISQPEIISTSIVCKSNVESNGIEVGNHKLYDLIPVKIRDNTNEVGISGSCCQISALPNHLVKNVIDKTLSRQSPLDLMSADNPEFNNLNHLDIQHVATANTKKVINTDVIDEVTDANLGHSFFKDEITNTNIYSGVIKDLNKINNCKALVPWAEKQNFNLNSRLFKEELANRFTIRNLIFDRNTLFGLPVHGGNISGLYHLPGNSYEYAQFALKSNDSDIDNALNLGEHHWNNEENQITKLNTVNICKSIVPYSPFSKLISATDQVALRINSQTTVVESAKMSIIDYNDSRDFSNFKKDDCNTHSSSENVHFAFKPNDFFIDNAFNLEEQHRNNNENHIADRDTVDNSCKSLVPYCPSIKLKCVTDQAVLGTIPLIYSSPETRTKLKEFKELTIKNVNFRQNVNISNLIVPSSDDGFIHKYSLISNSSEQLYANKDTINNIDVETIIMGRKTDVEPANISLNDGRCCGSYENINSNTQSYINVATTIKNINVEQPVRVNLANLPNLDNVKVCKRKNKYSPDFNDSAWSDDEVINKQIKLSIDTLERNLDICENEERFITNTDEKSYEGDLDDIIEHSIHKYEISTEEKSILATPNTCERSSQTSPKITLSHLKMNCKRCLFSDDDSCESKKIKYSDINSNDSLQNISEFSEDTNSELEKNDLKYFHEIIKETTGTAKENHPPMGDVPRFDDSVSQFYITPSATVPALAVGEDPDDCKPEDLAVNSEEHDDDINSDQTSNSDSSTESSHDQMVPNDSQRFVSEFFIRTGQYLQNPVLAHDPAFSRYEADAPAMHVTPKKPILRVGLSRRARPKPLHSPSP